MVFYCSSPTVLPAGASQQENSNPAADETTGKYHRNKQLALLLPVDYHLCPFRPPATTRLNRQHIGWLVEFRRQILGGGVRAAESFVAPLYVCWPRAGWHYSDEPS
jgi:hypothetical protein